MSIQMELIRPIFPLIMRRKPLQTAKFAGILFTIGLAMAGFFRLIDAKAFIDGPLLGDGQFLALVLLPLASLGLVIIVFAETLVSSYRSLRSQRSFGDILAGRTGYLLIRSIEAGFAVVGVFIMASAVPAMFAENTPAPAGVGLMLLLFVVGLGILFASLARTTAELFVYTRV